jgi:hypothetical protein
MTHRPFYRLAGAIGLLLLFTTTGCTSGLRDTRISPLPAKDQSLQAGTGILGQTQADLSLYVSIQPHEAYNRIATVSYAVVNQGDQPVAFGPDTLSIRTDDGRTLPILTTDAVASLVDRRYAGFAEMEIARMNNDYSVRKRLPDRASSGRYGQPDPVQPKPYSPRERLPQAVLDQVRRDYRSMARREAAGIQAAYLTEAALAPSQRQEGLFFVRLPHRFTGELTVVTYPESGPELYAFLVE